MVEKNEKLMKGFISEEDISTLLQRYTATTVLALLQKVAHCPDVKIDWNALVRNTSTGISDAREYQMLWRHLAYRQTLLDKLEYGGHPVDDDSDLEYETEARPAFSSDEAAACVKILIGSSLPSVSSLPTSSVVEAPLTINIPNGLSSRASSNSEATCSMQGMNITVPVSLQKLPLSAATPGEGLDGNGSASGNFPPRRKRKPWSETEDMELIAAVKKCGEGNWAIILREDFKGDRTASQLSQRWATIRKQRGKLNVGPNSTGSQLSEAQRAAHHAMSLALDMPVKNLTAVRSVGGNATTSSLVPPTAEAAMVATSSMQARDQGQEGSSPNKSSPVGSLGSTVKSQVSSIKPSTKPTICSDSSLRAAAVAAGARIASPSDAASLIKAARADNGVHVKPIGGSTKLSMPGDVSISSETQTKVHYGCTALEAKPCSSYHSVTVTNTASHPGSVKAVSRTFQLQHSPSTLAPSSNLSFGQTNAVSCSLPSGLLPKQEVKTAEEIKISNCSYLLKEVAEEGAHIAQSEQVKEDTALSRDMKAEFKQQITNVESRNSSLNMKSADSDHKAVIDNRAEATQNGNGNEILGSPVGAINQSALEAICKNQDSNGEQGDLPTINADGCSQKL